MDSRCTDVHRKDIPQDCTATLENKDAKEKRCITEKRTVDDRSTSVSYWTLPMMCKYIDFRRNVSRWPSEVQISQEEIWLQADDTFIENCRESWSNYNRGISTISSDQSTRNMTEAAVKFIIFVMISPLLKQLDLMMDVEETISVGCLPSCRLDYVLKSGDIPVGAIEVKRSDSFDKKAFAQAVMQLLVLQQWAYKKGLPYRVNMIEVPIVNILTDGERFVLMMIKGEMIHVQKSKPREEGFLRHKLIVLSISQGFRTVYEQLHNALSPAVSKLKQLIHRTDSQELDERYIHTDDRQGGAPVQRSNNYPNRISVHPKWNDHLWREFLSPLKEKDRKRKQAVGGSVDDTIEGPRSLSRTVATKLGDRFLVRKPRY